MSKKQVLIECVCALLILLFLYASVSKFLDPLPRLGHHVTGDRHLGNADFRIYKTARSLRITSTNDSIYIIHGDHPAPFFPVHPLFMWRCNSKAHLEPTSLSQFMLRVLINIRNYPTASEVF